MNNRINEINRMIQDDSEDPFLWYLLALEYEKHGERKKTRDLFQHVLGRFPDYLPVYYQAAHLFWEMGFLEEARDIFMKGIALAEKNRDIKTEMELKNAYQNFLMELDEE